MPACTWLRQVNTERPSDATGLPPAVRLAEEQPKFGPLPAVASDYGFFDCVVVSREGLVAIETNRYSVPAPLMGRALTARIHASRIELFADQVLVATHVRCPAQNARVIDPAHFEAAFASKPRGRVMVYRHWPCSLSPVVMTYVQEISHKRRSEMKPQLIALYDLAQEIGKADFVAALALAAEQQMYGVEYLRAIVMLPSVSAPNGSAQATSDPLACSGPSQPEVERDLAHYERYVANRESMLQEELVVQGVQA
ncbi:MAG: hypothetical protein NVSMB49_24530 [Ktedonobacteraceae bacterium]